MHILLTVDADEIKRLGKRFKKLDLDNSGSLSVDEFMSLPELQQNPLVQRVIDIFDTDGNGEVDFKGKWQMDKTVAYYYNICANYSMYYYIKIDRNIDQFLFMQHFQLLHLLYTAHNSTSVQYAMT